MGSSLRSSTLRLRLTVVLVAVALLGACTGGDDSDDAQSQEATRVDRLIYAVPPPTQEAMNPNRDMQPQDEFQLKPMYENLIGAEPETGAWIPMLAEDWELENGN